MRAQRIENFPCTAAILVYASLLCATGRDMLWLIRLLTHSFSFASKAHRAGMCMKNAQASAQ